MKPFEGSSSSLLPEGSHQGCHAVGAQVRMLEKLMQAVTAVEHRKASYGRGKAADQPETGISDMAQVRVPYAGCSAWEVSPLQSLTGGGVMFRH